MAKTNKTAPLTRPYQPTAKDLAAVESVYQHSSTTPRIKVSTNEAGAKVAVEHPDAIIGAALLAEAIGTADLDFFNGLLGQLASAVSKGGQIREADLQFMLSVVKGISPSDQVEAMLGAQMAAVHMAVMRLTRQLAEASTLPYQDGAERALTKLLRVFATQIEALKRYRTGGEQKVTVQHVTVSEGGQAIVGSVTQTAREIPPSTASLAAVTDNRSAPMATLRRQVKAPSRGSRRSKSEL